MIYVTVQDTDVPALGFGTWDLRGNACRVAVKDALGVGYRHIDTAQGYDNEAEVGQAITDSGVAREQIFLTTKVKPDNFRAAETLSSSYDSLKKLQTDYVDLLLMHWPNPKIPLEETLKALNRLKQEGHVRHIGVSNFPPSLVAEAQQYATIFCNQVEYHPYLSQPRLLKQAKEMDYLLTAYSPIAHGKVKDDPVLKDIGHTHNKSPVQVTLRWLIQQEKVAAIPKAASEAHRRSNFDIFDFELSDDEMQRIFSLEHEERLINPADGPAWERD